MTPVAASPGKLLHRLSFTQLVFRFVPLAHALPDLTGDMFVGGASERLVAHNTFEDVFVAVHTLDEQLIKHPFEVRGKVLEGVGPRRLGHLVRVLGRGSDLVEEELIGLGEIGAEALVELFDQGGQLDCIILGPGGAHIGRPLEGISLAVTKVVSNPRGLGFPCTGRIAGCTLWYSAMSGEGYPLPGRQAGQHKYDLEAGCDETGNDGGKELQDAL